MKTIAVTMGDPCGVGPEVVLKALRRLPVPPHVRLLVIGDRSVLTRTARRLGLSVPAWAVVPQSVASGQWPVARVLLVDLGRRSAFVLGRTSSAAGRAALAYLDAAIALWRAGCIDGIVTAPVTKWAIAQVKPGFVGQTEYLASAAHRREVVMLFVSDRLRVALVTRHVPMGRVPRALTAPLLTSTVRLTHAALREQFGIPRPRLALCGLNPHAGEAGRCGREELTVMEPALRRLRADGLACAGPFAADGLFAAGTSAYDAVICPYHDQGLIPFKMLARDQGCQMTLGLPFVRTSPDHGSALDVAGKGVANPGSMMYAIRLAIRLIAQRDEGRANVARRLVSYC